MYLCLFGIGLLVTFLIIRAAIDSSKTYEEITEIRRLLELLVEKSYPMTIKTVRPAGLA